VEVETQAGRLLVDRNGLLRASGSRDASGCRLRARALGAARSDETYDYGCGGENASQPRRGALAGHRLTPLLAPPSAGRRRVGGLAAVWKAQGVKPLTPKTPSARLAEERSVTLPGLAVNDQPAGSANWGCRSRGSQDRQTPGTGGSAV
jgi:hypothetical protein